MAFTQSELDSLEKAIAEGALIVQYADRRVEYRSLDDMLRTRDLIRKELGLVENRNSRVETKYRKDL